MTSSGEEMPTVLHVIHSISGGGAARAMLACAKAVGSGGAWRQSALSLVPGDASVSEVCLAHGVTYLGCPDQNDLDNALAGADIVHMHYWNSPELLHLLLRGLPPVRCLATWHIGGMDPPHVLSPQLLDCFDHVQCVGPITLEAEAVRNRVERGGAGRVSMAYPAVDLDRFLAIRRSPGEGVTIGYLGTLDGFKIHPDYIAMSARVSFPRTRFVLWGGTREAGEALLAQAEALGVRDRFDFRGYVPDAADVFSKIDIFGYPLCEGNYSAGELVLQECFAAGVPVVVLPHGGAGRMVVHGQTGLVARSPEEYATALDRLAADPLERLRLGENARQWAREHFGAEKTAQATLGLYNALMKRGKRARVMARRVARAGSPVSGAEAFLEGLGGACVHFQQSYFTGPHRLASAADACIAASSDVLCSGSGGVFHYLDVHPNDFWLRLWTGLIHARRGALDQASAEFRAALACPDAGLRAAHHLAACAMAQARAARDVHTLEQCYHTGHFLGASGYRVQAAEIFRFVVRSGQDQGLAGWALFKLGEQAWEEGRVRTARRLFRQALAANAAIAKARIHLAPGGRPLRVLIATGAEGAQPAGDRIVVSMDPLDAGLWAYHFARRSFDDAIVVLPPGASHADRARAMAVAGVHAAPGALVTVR
ncbi:MAG: glycosyltransferase [Desulfovibrionaceae bacterium]|nr:glycosyltransferase [Desulfovibrionaceae bacterium]